MERREVDRCLRPLPVEHVSQEEGERPLVLAVRPRRPERQAGRACLGEGGRALMVAEHDSAEWQYIFV